MGKEKILDYSSDYNSYGDKDESITCKFKIKYCLDDGILKECVSKSIDWMGKVSKPLIIMKNGDDEFVLKVVGRGRDDRCRLCRSFRTRLRNISSENGLKIKQKVFCRFDEEGDYGLADLEILKDRAKTMELGLPPEEDATQEEYNKIINAIKKLEGEI